MSKALTYQLAAGGTLEISMVGTIGDGWSEDPITAKGVRKALDSSKNVQSIKAHIDSSGGNFFEGLAIYQMLQEHPADVEITIGARAASAASLIAMAGDSISMHETSTMLVHPVWTIAMGNAAELRKVADEIDQLSESAVTAYAARTGMDAKAMRSLMAEDRFMSATEAKKLGFATHIRKAKDNKQSSISEPEVRDEIENMRTHAQASAAALRVAAMSPQQPTQTQPAPSAPVNNEEQHMNLAVILAALSLSEGATEAQVLTSINGLKASAEAGTKTLSLLGAKSFDEAQGTIAALNSAKEQGAKDAAELKSLREKSEQSERDGIVAKLEAEGKVTPAQKKDLLPTLSLAGLKAFAATAPKVLTGDGKTEPRTEVTKTGTGGEQALQHKGKTYAQMSNTERAELRKENSELFATMRQQAIDTGAI